MDISLLKRLSPKEISEDLELLNRAEARDQSDIARLSSELRLMIASAKAKKQRKSKRKRVSCRSSLSSKKREQTKLLTSKIIALAQKCKQTKESGDRLREERCKLVFSLQESCTNLAYMVKHKSNRNAAFADVQVILERACEISGNEKMSASDFSKERAMAARYIENHLSTLNRLASADENDENVQKLSGLEFENFPVWESGADPGESSSGVPLHLSVLSGRADSALLELPKMKMGCEVFKHEVSSLLDEVNEAEEARVGWINLKGDLERAKSKLKDLNEFEKVLLKVKGKFENQAEGKNGINREEENCGPSGPL